MTRRNILFIGFFVTLLLIVSCSKSLVYNSVKNGSQCSKKEGYWYKNKCWKNYEDEGISASKIDSTVSSQMEIIRKSIITIDNQTFQLIAFLPIKEDEGMLLISVYKTQNNYKTLVFPTGKKHLKNETLESKALLFDGDAISGTVNMQSKLEGTATIKILNFDELDFEISGEIINSEKKKERFVFKTNEAIMGAGNSHIEIKENEAYLSGGLGTVTYQQIKDLIKNHPKVRTIVMTHISGSLNDDVNMHTGRLLRDNNFTTKVLANSDIASGGVDLFCAGKKRIVIKGAKIGVHSWCCIEDLTAIEIPKDHPAHKDQLKYFTIMLGAVKGPGFYYYTLNAAPFDGIHYMTNEEIKEWNISTEFIDNE